jgi:hypothetical protein
MHMEHVSSPLAEHNHLGTISSYFAAGFYILIYILLGILL